MTKGQAVYTVAIDNDYGIDTAVFTTREAAEAHVAAYVKDWWLDEFGGCDYAPEVKSLSPSEAVVYYFENNASSERYAINENVIKS